jgi:hypothetical protein
MVLRAVAMNHGMVASAHASWVATPAARKAVLLLAVTLAAFGLAQVVAAGRSHPVHEVRLVQEATKPPLTTDAVGCPSTARCDLMASATRGMAVAVASDIPGSHIITQDETIDDDSGRVYRTSILGVTTSGNIFSAQAQCVPGAGAQVGYFVPHVSEHVDLAGNTVVDSDTMTITVPGITPGCGVAVQLQSGQLVRMDQIGAILLANDKLAQLDQ